MNQPHTLGIELSGHFSCENSRRGNEGMTNPTVYIVDDDSDVRLARTCLLRSHHYRVQGHAAIGHFLRQKCSPGPACLVVDAEVSVMPAPDLLALLRRENAHLSVIVISSQGNIQIAVRAMKAGAADFLLKPVDDARLLSAVEAGAIISEKALAKRNELMEDLSAFVSLSPREKQVCLGIARGLLNKQIGFELGTAEKTIKVQRGHLMQKLRAQSVPDIVRLVDRLRTADLITTPSTRPPCSPSPVTLRPLFHTDANQRTYSVGRLTG
jgi:FixJ family two-component response regulator